MDDEMKAKTKQRRDDMAAALADEAPFTFTDHKHLDADTPERAYYHYGYICALADVLKLADAKQA